jgi:lysyl-tRNA synthetase class 2
MYTFDDAWLDKLAAMRERGEEPYPNGLSVTHTSTELHARFVDVEDPSADPLGEVQVAGRLMFRNRMGKVLFLRIADRGEPTVPSTDKDGEDVLLGGVIQVFVRKNDVGDEAYERLKRLDIGDWVHARGTMMRTKTGELTVRAVECTLASKILNTFPDRQKGIADVELRSRQRYVDLFMNASTRRTFRLRSRIIRYIRNYFEDREFLEVETPMMQVIPGGAAARPFVTHHNALDIDLYLRIAPELYLKRLLVGGLERVFEINRNFRNEGVSTKHNPEFTMLEFYQAWATMDDLMDLTEELVSGLVDEVVGTRVVQFGDHRIDFSTPWRRADMDQLISEQTGLSLEQLADPEAMAAFWREKHPGADDDLPTVRGKWWEKLFDAYVEHTLVNPTFVTGFPTEISPLSRRNDSDPSRVDRFELTVATWEIANAFSELNDPVDQAERFAAQAAARDAGDEESMYFDADYIRALTYAMPPAAGEGIGIDRLVMLLTGCQSIREVILFPTLRPEQGEPSP